MSSIDDLCDSMASVSFYENTQELLDCLQRSFYILTDSISFKHTEMYSAEINKRYCKYIRFVDLCKNDQDEPYSELRSLLEECIDETHFLEKIAKSIIIDSSIYYGYCQADTIQPIFKKNIPMEETS